MPESLFGAAVPATQDAADGTNNYTLGVRFTPSVNGTATHGRWRFPNTTPSATVAVQVGIYRVSDQQSLGSASFPLNPTLGAWNEVAFSSPINLLAGVTYVVAIWTPLRYVATANYAWPATSTNLTANATNGWLFGNSGSLAYPNTQSGNAANYFADLVFETGDTTPPSTPTGLTASAIGANNLDLSWNAATDNVGVTGYQIQVVGP